MSIIYEALKKTQGKLSSPEEIKKKKNLIKFYIAFSIIALIVCSYVLSVLLYNPPAVENKTRKNGLAARAKKGPNSSQGFTLTGIIEVENEKMALINEELIKKGDSIDGASVVDILDNKVYLDLAGKPIILKIK